MEMKIFNHVLHGSLMPWVFDRKEIKIITKNLKLAGKKTPTTQAELSEQIQTLLSHKIDLVKWLQSQKADEVQPLKNLSCSTYLLEYHDNTTQFYTIVIQKEAQRIFNGFLIKLSNLNNPEDIYFYATGTIKTLKRYIILSAKEIRKRGFKDIDHQKITLVPFVLYQLKYSLIALYFNLLKVKRELLKEDVKELTNEVHEFYFMELHETKSDIRPVYFEDPAVKYISKKDSKKPQKLSFGFRGDRDKLKTVIDQLCIKVDFLNEDLSPSNILLELLISKEIKPGRTKVYINCETKVFRYIIDKLKPYFSKLTLRNISNSNSFYSRENNNKTIKENNLSVSGIGDIKPEPKERIEKIIKHLQ